MQNPSNKSRLQRIKFKQFREKSEARNLFAQLQQKRQNSNKLKQSIQLEYLQLVKETKELVSLKKRMDGKLNQLETKYMKYKKQSQDLDQKKKKLVQVDQEYQNHQLDKQLSQLDLHLENLKKLLRQKTIQKQQIQQKFKQKQRLHQQYKDKLQWVQREIKHEQSQRLKMDQAIQNGKEFLKFIKYWAENLDIYNKQVRSQLQERKGNIRVYCRIRKSKPNQKLLKYKIEDNLISINLQRKIGESKHLPSQYQFEFDHIFDQNTTQTQVFNEIKQLIQNSIHGKNVCMFVYGSTGSGKSYTMEGDFENKQYSGIIPRSIELIYQKTKKYEQLKNSKISISIHEIYNQKVIDLVSNIINQRPIFHNITSFQKAAQYFYKACKNRSTAFTQCNKTSSRSHLIIIIRISIQKQYIKNQTSHLVMVDLAGTQNPEKSGVTGDRLTQTSSINKSLSQFKQVFEALKDKKTTTFRNSKLTYILKQYLKKESKPIMFVNISPAALEYYSSLESLRFASKVRMCRMKQEQ